jgi:hypothetical protein
LKARCRIAAVFFGLVVAGCELTEVAAPAGADLLVVEAVLRVGARQQYLILHRTLGGRVVRGERNAHVSVTRPDGPAIPFREVALESCLMTAVTEWDIEDLNVAATCYASPIEAGRWVQPAATYDLSILTADGLDVRGRTRVPGTFSFAVPAVSLDPLTLAARCRLPADSFDLAWTRSDGAWAYLSTLWLTEWGDELRDQGVEVPDPLELTGVSVSAADTTIRFPSELGLFQRTDFDQRVLLALQDGLPPEASATLVVLAADRNFTNAIRGGRFNPSGNVRASSVIGGGVGVFGSVLPLTIRSSADSSGALPAACPLRTG